MFKVGQEGLTTKNGNPVRIYATDGQPPHTIHGAIQIKEQWISMQWCADGSYVEGFKSQHDITEPKQIRWLNIYPYGVAYAYETKEVADKYLLGSKKRLACIKIEYTPGEGI